MEADPDQAEGAPIMMRSARTAVVGIRMGIIAIHVMRISRATGSAVCVEPVILYNKNVSVLGSVN